jgi:hypothetical protein
MSTVVSRVFASTPKRDAAQTWSAIVELLTQGKNETARKELLSVAGIAASTLADHATKDVPIVVTCDGPRTRIYCLYDDDALEASDANEDMLGFDPLAGDWRISLPCPVEDLTWVQGALKKHSTRITARDLAEEVAKAADTQSANALVFDQKGFLGT